MVVVWRSGGAISGGQLLVFAGILLAGLLLAGAEVLLRRAVDRIHAAGNRPQSHRQR
jgi:HAMP domain-containing protein